MLWKGDPDISHGSEWVESSFCEGGSTDAITESNANYTSTNLSYTNMVKMLWIINW